jgi:dihydrofolate reductase
MSAAKAFIIGRNMFGPVRGEWDRPWNGWWGDNPPFHRPVFVLTEQVKARAASQVTHVTYRVLS